MPIKFYQQNDRYYHMYELQLGESILTFSTFHYAKWSLVLF